MTCCSYSVKTGATWLIPPCSAPSQSETHWSPPVSGRSQNAYLHLPRNREEWIRPNHGQRHSTDRISCFAARVRDRHLESDAEVRAVGAVDRIARLPKSRCFHS